VPDMMPEHVKHRLKKAEMCLRLFILTLFVQYYFNHINAVCC
jgi:hypothetical protein